jgi:hypothetical protein
MRVQHWILAGYLHAEPLAILCFASGDAGIILAFFFSLNAAIEGREYRPPPRWQYRRILLRGAALGGLTGCSEIARTLLARWDAYNTLRMDPHALWWLTITIASSWTFVLFLRSGLVAALFSFSAYDRARNRRIFPIP